MDLKPHKTETWIHKPIENIEEFNETVEVVCEVYKQAPLLAKQGVHTISIDEKTGIQALEREITHMSPGQIERQDNEYKRHGTQCLIANLDVVTGEIISPTISNHRTEKDFVEHIEKTLQQDKTGKWIFICDNLNTHQSESLVRLVAKSSKINKNLGVKGKDGILKSMNSRAEFLSDTKHRIRLVYTPKHASWLNQIEIWFSIIVKRLLKRLSVFSVKELKEKIVALYIYNKGGCPPCGICLQVIAEFATKKTLIYWKNADGKEMTSRIGDLLPYLFNQKFLKK